MQGFYLVYVDITVIEIKNNFILQQEVNFCTVFVQVAYM